MSASSKKQLHVTQGVKMTALSSLGKSENVSGAYVHPVADIYPMMSSSEMFDLQQDIMRNGQREPVVVKTLSNRTIIIDGRNRWVACQLLETKPKTVEWKGGMGEELIEFIQSKNLYRRQLTSSQRAMLVVETARLLDEERGKRKRGRPSKAAKKKSPATTLKSETKTTAGAVAKKANVGATTAKAAIAVKDSGDKKLAKEVIAGKKSVKAAAKEVREKKAPPKKKRQQHRDPQSPEAVADKLLAKHGVEWCGRLMLSIESTVRRRNARPPRKPTTASDAKLLEDVSDIVNRAHDGL